MLCQPKYRTNQHPEDILSKDMIQQTFSNQYLHNAECLWKVQVQQGLNIILTFNEISIEYSQNCKYDYVDVVYGGRNDLSNLKSQYFCGYYFDDIKVFYALHSTRLY